MDDEAAGLAPRLEPCLLFPGTPTAMKPDFHAESARSEDGRFRLVRWTGEITENIAFDLLQFDGTLGQPEGSVMLLDLRHASLDLDYEKSKRLADRVAAGIESPVAMKVAILADADLSFGIVRQYISFVNNPLREAASFRSFDEACVWLGDPGDVFTKLEKALAPVVIPAGDGPA